MVVVGRRGEREKKTGQNSESSRERLDVQESCREVRDLWLLPVVARRRSEGEDGEEDGKEKIESKKIDGKEQKDG